ncbi:MAG TPA: hypothetical protein VH302_15305 [Bryobacteraceae bacterium]|jgi:hypothetical protein|nr:hypothetical protein [Bryobacteraceae bacterium]
MTTRTLLSLFAFALGIFARTADDSDVVSIAKKVFDGMAARDTGMIRSTLMPEARFYSMRGDAPPVSTSAEDFIAHLASVQGTLLERFTGQPKVLVHGRIAQVWGEYEFLRDGKFVHCGLDSFSLFKTSEGWKIAAIAYTADTTGCPGH